MSRQLISHIKEFEGLSLTSYKDIAGIWTIGYGHTGPEVKKGQTITLEEAVQLLDDDTRWAFAAVESSVKVPITENQEAALISLTYNIGASAFAGSTVVKRLNKGDYYGASEAILMWDKARIAGTLTVVRGLARRREAERDLFLTGMEQNASVAEEGRTKITQSGTMRNATAQIGAAGGVVVTALTATDGTAQIVLIIGGIMIVMAALFIMRSRIRKWADGIR